MELSRTSSRVFGMQSMEESDISATVSEGAKLTQAAELLISVRLIYNSEIENACNLIKSMAEKGNPFAQCELGRMYRFGIGVNQDRHQAINQFEKAAENRSAEACMHLGDMLCKSNPKLALDWYIKAVPADCCELKNIYSNGDTLPKEGGTSRWLLKLGPGHLGPGDACFKIGTLSLEGGAIALDRSLARYWFSKADYFGSDCACERMGALSVGVDVNGHLKNDEVSYWSNRAECRDSSREYQYQLKELSRSLNIPQVETITTTTTTINLGVSKL